MNIQICGSGFLSKAIKIVSYSPEESQNSIVYLDSFEDLVYLHRLSNSDLNEVRTELDRREIDVLINLSGPSSIEESIINQSLYLREPSQQISKHFEIISLLRKKPTYIFASSASVYGDNPDFPSEESSPKPMSPYAEGKVLAENSLSKFSRELDVKAFVLRLTSLFNQDLNGRVLGKIRNDLRSIGDVRLSGNGFESRDFLHTSYLNQVIKKLLELDSQSKFQIFNIGSGKPLQIYEVLIMAFTKIFGITLTTEQALSKFNGEERLFDPKNISCSTAKIESVLPGLGKDFRRELEDYF